MTKSNPVSPVGPKAIAGRAISAVALLLALSGCQEKAPDVSGPPPVAVTTEVMAPRAFERWTVATGSVEATTFAALASPAEGPVITLRVREGDRVDRGTALVQIGRQASAAASRASAVEELRRAEADLRRVEVLVNEKAVAGSQLDTARASHERARAALAQAQQAEGDFIVRAPWPGVVSAVRVAEGNFVAPRAVLVEMFDPSSLVLRFALDEQNASAVQAGSLVHASFDTVPGHTFDLQVIRVYPALDRRTRTRTFEATLPTGIELAPGMFARLRIVRETHARALTVPVESVLQDGDQSFVFLAQDGKAVRREVTPAFEQDGRVMLHSGVQPGDEVIVGGIERVKTGSAIRKPSPASTAATDTKS